MAIGPISPVNPAAGPAPVPPVSEPDPVAAVAGRLAALARTGTPVPPGPAPTAQSAQARAVTAAVQAAAPRQGGLAPLLADLAEALGSPVLPPAVREAAVRLLGLRTSLTPAIDAATLRAAAARSGLFLEAGLAARPPAPGAPPPPDLKAALLGARQVLGDWAEQAGPAAPRPAREPPPPPFRHGPLAAQPPVAASLSQSSEPHAIAQRLLTQTDAALARQELMQAASLPPQRPADPAEPPGRGHWMFEIAFATPQGSAVAPFEIDRDGAGTGDGAAAGPGWRARFALDIEPFGPVQAEVALSGGRAGVRLWAERPEAALRLRERQDLLLAALAAADYAPELSVAAGAPPRAAAPAGQFMDRSS